MEGLQPTRQLTADILAGDQVKKYGAEAADKIQHINTQNVQPEAESEISKLKKEVRAYTTLQVLSCASMYVAAERPDSAEPQSVPIDRWLPRDSQD